MVLLFLSKNQYNLAVKQLSLSDIRASASRKDLGEEADAAQILHVSERLVAEKIGRDFFYRAHTFWGGIIFF